MGSTFYTRHDGGLTLFKDGKQSTVSNTHPNFEKILDALKLHEFDKLSDLMDIERTINKSGVSKKLDGRKVYTEDGKVYYVDSHKKVKELNGALVDRIIDDLGKPSFEKYGDALIAFLDNIMKNKVKDIREELYDFLMSGKTPITYDGCFLAYKKVKDNFFDIYTGKMNNSPGEVVRMNQEDVDKDRNNECSKGLHFASLGYLSNYGSASKFKVVIVKVNPRHVFAIPRDYNYQKGRASEYYVVGEYVSKNCQSVDAFKDSFIDEDTKIEAAPEVKFVGSLKPSLEKVAESYGLVKDGKVKITEVSGKKVALPWDGVASEHLDDVVIMSFETKSVRAAVKEKVDKLKNE